MNSLLFIAASKLMGFTTGNSVLGERDPDLKGDYGDWNWVKDIADAINWAIYPIMIIVGAAGAIYAIVLGVNLARADSADKQQEAKKRMINAIIGLVSIIALLFLMKLFCENIHLILPEISVDPAPTA